MKILLSCFDINPYKGSEASVGWNFSLSLSKRHEVFIIANESCREDVDKYISVNGENPNLHFYYLDSDFNWNIIKLWPPLLYHYINKWEKKVFGLAQQLNKKYDFDIIHKLTLTGFRSPGYLYEISKPFVWGPIGGFQISPWCLLPSLGLKNMLFYGIRNLLNYKDILFNKNVRRCVSKADVIISATQDGQKRIKKYWHKTSVLMPEVGFVPGYKRHASDEGMFKIAWSSVFYPRKALNFLIEAVAASRHKNAIEINIVGGGNLELEKRWKHQADSLGVNCVWHGLKKRNESIDIISSCHLFSITSVADMTSTVLLEALSASIPVIVPDEFGFSNVVTDSCGIKIKVKTKKQFINNYSEAIDKLFEDRDLLNSLANGAYLRATEFAWDKKVQELERIYLGLIENR